jgi:hypothetical protein
MKRLINTNKRYVLMVISEKDARASDAFQGCDPYHKKELIDIVSKYDAIFQEPDGLPPKREIQHEIHLQQDSPLPNVGMYRMSILEMTEIKKQEHGLLDQGVIGPSSSPRGSKLLKLLRCSPVLEEVHFKLLLYSSSFACLNQCEDHFSARRKATKSFQHFEGEDQYCPVLALPNLQQPFEIEIDASGYAMGVVLMQYCKPICHHSETFNHKVVNYPTYDKELYALVQSVKKWKHYLLGKETIIHIDHQTL